MMSYRMQPTHCQGWPQEGLYRLLENVLSPAVAENPYEWTVYGTGRAIRNKAALLETQNLLADLREDETLLIQSGQPVAVFATHPMAPRVLISNGMLVPKWANWDHHYQLEQKGLLMYGQSTAASWAYIGAQGILQNTYETLREVAESWGGTLLGKWVLTSGLGGMGCAQPLAVKMNGGVAIVAEVSAEQIQRRLDTGYIDVATNSIENALQMAQAACRKKYPLSIGLLGHAGTIYDSIANRGMVPDIVTDQTPAHDLLRGYIPDECSVSEALRLRTENPSHYLTLSAQSVVRHTAAMLRFAKMGSIIFEYGNHLRAAAKEAGLEQAVNIPSFITLFARQRLSRGDGPLRFIALSGKAQDIFQLDAALLKHYPHNQRMTHWLHYAQENVHFQGLPARSVWLTYEEREQLCEWLPEYLNQQPPEAPLAITRDHFAGSTMASPHRETETMPDGSDAVADWPILNSLLMTASGATMVTVQQGGGVGVGQSLHSGMTLVLHSTEDLPTRLQRVLMGEAKLGVLRYQNAGYPPQPKRKGKDGVI
ncbi:urocanate hydratase [Alicyclobacillus sp. TC]|nr:urocanate hydratase [Alicyclobacillus sp. TC]